MCLVCTGARSTEHGCMFAFWYKNRRQANREHKRRGKKQSTTQTKRKRKMNNIGNTSTHFVVEACSLAPVYIKYLHQVKIIFNLRIRSCSYDGYWKVALSPALIHFLHCGIYRVVFFVVCKHFISTLLLWKRPEIAFEWDECIEKKKKKWVKKLARMQLMSEISQQSKDSAERKISEPIQKVTTFNGKLNVCKRIWI